MGVQTGKQTATGHRRGGTHRSGPRAIAKAARSRHSDSRTDNGLVVSDVTSVWETGPRLCASARGRLRSCGVHAGDRANPARQRPRVSSNTAASGGSRRQPRWSLVGSLGVANSKSLSTPTRGSVNPTQTSRTVSQRNRQSGSKASREQRLRTAQTPEEGAPGSAAKPTPRKPRIPREPVKLKASGRDPTRAFLRAGQKNKCTHEL